MSTATGEIESGDVLKPVLWSQMKHLGEGVREIESRAQVNVIL